MFTLRLNSLLQLFSGLFRDLESLKETLGKALQEVVNDHEEKLEKKNNKISKVWARSSRIVALLHTRARDIDAKRD